MPVWGSGSACVGLPGAGALRGTLSIPGPTTLSMPAAGSPSCPSSMGADGVHLPFSHQHQAGLVASQVCPGTLWTLSASPGLHCRSTAPMLAKAFIMSQLHFLIFFL